MGIYYFVDVEYPNTNQFIVSYCGVRFHLKEFGPSHTSPQDDKELFKFWRFQSPLQYPTEV